MFSQEFQKNHNEALTCFLKAQDYYYAGEYEISATFSRKCLEYIVKSFCKQCKIDTKGKDLNSCISDLGKTTFLSNSEVDLLHQARKIGNKGAHTVSINKDESYYLLSMMIMILEVFDRKKDICHAVTKKQSSHKVKVTNNNQQRNKNNNNRNNYNYNSNNNRANNRSYNNNQYYYNNQGYQYNAPQQQSYSYNNAYNPNYYNNYNQPSNQPRGRKGNSYKNGVVAIVLAIMFGSHGISDIYLRHYGIGFTKLIGIPALLILCGPLLNSDVDSPIAVIGILLATVLYYAGFVGSVIRAINFKMRKKPDGFGFYCAP